MTKKIILAMVAVFAVWSVLDVVIHNLLLKHEYAATASLWRPVAEMKMLLLSGVTAAVSALFVLIYALLINPKSIGAGFKFGLLFGLAAGISMGLGSYSYMPITEKIALFWFFGIFFQLVIAGLITAWIVRD